MDKKTKILVGAGLGIVALYYLWSVHQPKAAVAAATATPAAPAATTVTPATPAAVAAASADGSKVFKGADGVFKGADGVFKGADGAVFAKAEGQFFKGHDTKW